jgi:hypothetical protein
MGRFKIVGDYYLSSWGGDNANAGTNPDLPLFNLAAAALGAGSVGTVTTQKNIVLGTGYYIGNFVANSINYRSFFGDGRAVVDFANSNVTQGISFILKNLVLKNCPLISPGNGVRIESCFLDNMASIGGNPGTLLNNVFKSSCTFNSGHVIQNCIILGNFGGGSLVTFRGNFVKKGVIVTVSAATALTTTFTNNCFNGLISRNGILYELKKLRDGSARPDADPGILDIATISPNVYTTYVNFAGDPKFLDLESKIVEPDSDLLKTTYESLYVGAVKPGKIVRLDDPNFEFTYARINTSNPLSVLVASGQPDGEIRITGKISDSLVSSRYLGLRTIFEYLKSALGGSGQNRDVPDGVKFLGLLPAQINRPRRLTYFMRTSLDPGANQASPGAIWDNDGVNPGEYLLFEVNTEPRQVSLGGAFYGNGDPRGDGQIGSAFNFRSVDIKIVLDNSRV